MVRKFLFILLALFALGSPAFAGKLNCEDCNLVRHGVHRQVTPTRDTVCVPFVQPEKGNVLLRLYLKDGTSRPYTKKNASKIDCIPVGRSWLEQSTGKSYICDDFNHFNYAQPGMIETLAKKPKYSREGEACLYGKDRCRAMGYPAY